MRTWRRLLADVLLGGTGIGGGVGHHESSSSGGTECGVAVLNPKVVPIVGAGKAEAAHGIVEVFVVGVALADVAAESVHREVETGETAGVGDALLAVDRDFGSGVFVMLLHKAGGLDEHAA